MLSATGLADDPFTVCRDIAAEKNAALYRAALHLPSMRRKFFMAAYASMRVIDDLIDDDFLCQSPDRRIENRENMLVTLANWKTQIEAAKTGAPYPAGPLIRPIYEGLRLTLGESDLEPGPWHRLACSLRADITEAPLQSWDAFYEYAQGATAAPAAIFIYVLSCRYDAEPGYLCPLPQPPLFYAQDMAVFCYLIHILRDLREDSGRAERLLTIPDEALDLAGLTRPGLVADLQRDSFPRIETLAEVILERALGFLERGQERSVSLLAHLDGQEAQTLSDLFAVYIDLADRMCKGYGAFLQQAQTHKEHVLRTYL